MEGAGEVGDGDAMDSFGVDGAVFSKAANGGVEQRVDNEIVESRRHDAEMRVADNEIPFHCFDLFH